MQWASHCIAQSYSFIQYNIIRFTGQFGNPISPCVDIVALHLSFYGSVYRAVNYLSIQSNAFRKVCYFIHIPYPFPGFFIYIIQNQCADT